MEFTSIAYAAAGTLHDATEGITAWGAFGSIVGVLVLALGSAILIIRRADLSTIRDTRDALLKLVEAVEGFREDLSKLRIYLAENYVTKGELIDFRRRLERVEGFAEKRRRTPLMEPPLGGGGP